MTPQVSFHNAAGEELVEAAIYYNTQSPGLGDAFLDEVESTINQILEHPEAAPLVNRLVRRRLVRRFPYSVMYVVQTEGIRVLAIANQKRRPLYWRGRE